MMPDWLAEVKRPEVEAVGTSDELMLSELGNAEGWISTNHAVNVRDHQ